MKNELGMIQNEAVVAYFGNILDIVWRDWKKTQKTIQTFGVQAEMQSKYFPNTSLELYRHTN
jgi:hypothetical protein